MIQIRKIFLIVVMITYSFIFLIAGTGYADNVEETYTLKTGISMIEQVPGSFFGTWRVVAKLSDTTSEKTFKSDSVDLWNLSRESDVINLSNPFTGASASIKVSYVSNNIIKFSKSGVYDNKRLTDTVELKLDGDKFTGANKLTLETLSNVDSSVVKTDTAVYILRAEKISGTSIIGK